MRGGSGRAVFRMNAVMYDAEAADGYTAFFYMSAILAACVIDAVILLAVFA